MVWLIFFVVVAFWVLSLFLIEFKQLEWRKHLNKVKQSNPPIAGWRRFWALVRAGLLSFSDKGKYYIAFTLLASILFTWGYATYQHNKWKDEQQIIAWAKEAEEQRQAEKLAHENQQRSITMEVARSAASEFNLPEDVESWIGEQQLVVHTAAGKWKAGDVTSPGVVEFLQAEKARLQLAKTEAVVEEYLVSTINERSIQSALQYLMKVREEIENIDLISRVDSKVDELQKELTKFNKEQDAKAAKRLAEAKKKNDGSSATSTTIRTCRLCNGTDCPIEGFRWCSGCRGSGYRKDKTGGCTRCGGSGPLPGSGIRPCTLH